MGSTSNRHKISEEVKLLKTKSPTYPKISKGHGSRQEKSFVKFVYHVLLSLDGSNVDEFCVTCDGVSEFFEASPVKSWVTTALSRNVRQLDTCMPLLVVLARLPDLFTCKTLAVPKLGSYILMPAASLVRLQNLETLHLHSVGLGDGDSADRLISSCPVLENLSLIECRWRDFRLFKIPAPLMKMLVASYLDPACYGRNDVVYHVSSDTYKIELNTPSLQSSIYRVVLTFFSLVDF
ncbi:F-box/FBD/LRR-repeat protein At5g56420-like isoform X2 [Rhododendron vialii]|uniref:F-box/FBD/LRR-repeat protein At5g56420-like isoform X2 n=1 Tax=Rhododendron vialii TaxID=182163 RepID=UPI00265EFC29|nr:F-box/FBD/LRR-repeat protein At5g56420-like isoform X2 [Rhododendron vialii]XP_058203766.1 F-box/FBD/LRR-repeat protein At5g56420-like isoform X2 [Rhododendron vialii]XP_058203768.1 F-box/FBD/LRR-repeat protein At5g56420-like isoform X2 [Rhododendron vialii]